MTAIEQVKAEMRRRSEPRSSLAYDLASLALMLATVLTFSLFVIALSLI